MTAYNFGVGQWFLRRTDVALTKPVNLGVMQDLELDVDQEIKELVGQYKFAVDIAPSMQKITGKGKFARVQADTFNNAILNGTETTASGFDIAGPEAHTSTGTTFTVTNGASFLEDLGLFYAATGTQLQPVASSPTVGQYIAPSGSPGTYTINAADENIALNAYYTFSVSTLTQIAIANTLMGTGSVFELIGGNNYAVLGVTKKINIKLNACRVTKMTLPFKNTDYLYEDIEFQAFADASGNLGTWVFSE